MYEWSEGLTLTHDADWRLRVLVMHSVLQVTVSLDNSVFPAELCSIFKLVSQTVQPSMGLDPRNVQLIAGRYTDYVVSESLYWKRC